jgi:hypothetical protein
MCKDSSTLEAFLEQSLNLHVGNEMLVIEKDKEPQQISSPSFTSNMLPQWLSLLSKVVNLSACLHFSKHSL